MHSKWYGKCPDCGTWDSLAEYREAAEVKQVSAAEAAALEVAGGDAEEVGADSSANGRGGREGGMGGRGGGAGGVMTLGQIEMAQTPRLKTGVGEFDRVLGGGLVRGSAVLVGGEPGIGKSTLLLQAAALMSDGSPPPSPPLGNAPKAGLAGDRKFGGVLYVTSEESARQTRLRAERLGLGQSGLKVMAETHLGKILHAAAREKPGVLVLDSIQMVADGQIPAAPGSVTQLRSCCAQLVHFAKLSGCAVILVGHVTKDGSLAGPKVIEHIVDAVLYFEGDRYHAHRMVRCIKNRFGATSELGLFEMTGAGLVGVDEPGGLFLQGYGGYGANESKGGGGAVSGSVLTAAVQGSRVILVEVQALTAASVIGAARRKTSGVSGDRVAMILAVLEKRCDFRLAADDVFVSVAGGVKVVEPGIDLAIALAVASAHTNRPVMRGMLAVGELGLAGEVRGVTQLEARLREASRLGVAQAVVPVMGKGVPALGGMSLSQVRLLGQAINVVSGQ